MVDCRWLYSGNDKSWQEVVISNASGKSDRMLTKENGDGGNECHYRLLCGGDCLQIGNEEGSGSTDINHSNFGIVLG